MNSLSSLTKKPNSPIRLAIGIPSGEEWKKQYGLSLAVMMCHLTQMIIPREDSQVNLVCEGGSILPQLRHKIVLQALAARATHLLFIDTDQSFPPDTFSRLYRWRKPVVACNIATKCFPSAPTARKKGGGPTGELVYTTASSRGLEKVWRIGTGIMLVDMMVFKKIPPPWFMNEYLPFEVDGQTVYNYGGEDWYFCKLLEKANIPIFVDHELSLEIGHHGNCKYDHDLVLQPQQTKEAS